MAFLKKVRIFVWQAADKVEKLGTVKKEFIFFKSKESIARS